MDPDSDELVAELAPGMGETLASGAQGLPWRLAVSKGSGGAMGQGSGSKATGPGGCRTPAQQAGAAAQAG